MAFSNFIIISFTNVVKTIFVATNDMLKKQKALLKGLALLF
jgi:hypothetical protein